MTAPQIWAAIATYGPLVIAAASAASAALPKPTPGTWYAVFRGLIDLLACNFGNAKNAS
jgi:hypothetical protein